MKTNKPQSDSGKTAAHRNKAKGQSWIEVRDKMRGKTPKDRADPSAQIDPSV